MIRGDLVGLRPIRDEDWPILEGWAGSGELWGDHQRAQLDHLPLLKAAYAQNALVSRESAMLLIEPVGSDRPVGFARYSMSPFPDQDLPHPDIGFGVAEPGDRGRGYATEATRLLVSYLFAGYPAERITAATDRENSPARRVLEKSGFSEEGTLRRSFLHHGSWHDLVLYGLLRSDWSGSR